MCGYCIAGSQCNATTHVCEKDSGPADAGSDTSTGSGEPGVPTEVIGSQTCPPGQVWSAYAQACVIDLNGNGAARSESGCAAGSSGAAMMLGGFFGLALLVTRRRGAVRAR